MSMKLGETKRKKADEIKADRQITDCFVYLLQSCDDGPAKSYVGWTTDLDKRLIAHNNGSGAKATRGRQWQLVHSEVFKTRGEAMSREYELKNDRRERKRILGDKG